MRPRAGTLEIICCTLAWGTIGSIVDRISLPSSVIVFFRLSLGFIVVLAWLALRGRLADLRLRARPVVLIVSGAVLGVHWALLFEAYKRIGVDTTILIGPVGKLWACAPPASATSMPDAPANSDRRLTVRGRGLVATSRSARSGVTPGEAS